MKQFDDVIASAMGVEGRTATPDTSSPFAVAAKLQRQYWFEILGFWKGILISTSTGGASAIAPR
jgi:polyhydroxyalkanoate synthase subunit PhaC